MKDAADKLAHTLASIKISKPKLPIIHNSNVDICDHPDEIRQRLVEQLYQPVRWVETMQRFAQEGIQPVVECGPGKVLSGLNKRIDPRLQPMNIENPADLTLTLENLLVSL